MKMEDPPPMPVNPKKIPADLDASGLSATSERKNKAPNLRYGACEKCLNFKEGLRKCKSDKSRKKEKKEAAQGYTLYWYGRP